MKALNRTIMLFSLGSLLSSCEKVLSDFNPRESAERVVIEGLVTDSLTRHYVRVTKTTSYTMPQGPPAIPNALVVITDYVSVWDTLEYTHEGYYLSKVWAGIPGRTYTATVYAEGKVYTASEELLVLPHFQIDSVQVRFDEVAKEDFTSTDFSDFRKFFKGDSLFKAYFYAREDQTTANYYMFDIMRNSAQYQNQDDIMVADDEIIQENIDGFELPGNFQRGDTVVCVMYGLTRSCYKYYEGIRNLMNYDGGMFSPPAGNPPTNLTGGALGYFQVSKQSAYVQIVK